MTIEQQLIKMIEKVERRLDTLQTYEYSSGGNSGVIASGAEFPSSPSDGTLFIHTPVGRSILYLYKSSTWVPIQSLGSMTMYVDGASGTDNMNHGTNTGASAFATLQYAIDMLPAIVTGNVVIYVSGSVGNVVIRGKSFSGAYTITITGEDALSVVETATDTGSGIQGSGASAGTVVKSAAWNSARVNKLIKGTGTNAVYRLTSKIKASDTKTMYIAGTWDADPAANDTFTVYDWGATIGTVSVSNNQTGIIINYCATGAVSVNQSSTLNMTGCSCNALTVQRGSSLYLTTCYVTAAICLICNYTSYFDADKSILAASGDGSTNSYIQYSSNATIRDGTCIKNGDIGIRCSYSSQVVCSNSSASGYIRVYSCTTGVTASLHSGVTGTSNNQYSDPEGTDTNGTNETAVAASYGYID